MIIFAPGGALAYTKDMPVVKQIKYQNETVRPL